MNVYWSKTIPVLQTNQTSSVSCFSDSARAALLACAGRYPKGWCKKPGGEKSIYVCPLRESNPQLLGHGKWPKMAKAIEEPMMGISHHSIGSCYRKLVPNSSVRTFTSDPADAVCGHWWAPIYGGDIVFQPL